jgi:hypothetical protein
MNADYKIKLQTGEVPLLFNTWMFREYTKLKGIEMEDLFTNIQTGQGFKAKDIPDLMLVANQSFCKYNGQECTNTDLDACGWLDEMGGFNSPQIIDLYKLFVSKLINVDPVQFELLWNKVTEPEKKEPEKKKAQVKNLHGEGSTNTQRKAG